MLRALYYVPACALWTVLVCGTGTVAGTLTLGLVSDRLINFFAPAWGRGMLFFLGVTLEVTGREHIAEPTARVMVMNHTSMLDMVAMAALNPPRMMALGKKEVAFIPFLGWAWWALGQAFIDRKNRKRAIASIQKMVDKLQLTPRSVVIFPEGTRSRDGRLQEFKMGAFHLIRQTNVPLVPMVISGAYELVRPDSIWVRPGTIWVDIHPPIDTRGWNEGNIKEKARALHDQYLEWVGQRAY